MNSKNKLILHGHLFLLVLLITGCVTQPRPTDTPPTCMLFRTCVLRDG